MPHAKDDQYFLHIWNHFIDELEEGILPIYQEHEERFGSYGIHGRMHIC